MSDKAVLDNKYYCKNIINAVDRFQFLFYNSFFNYYFIIDEFINFLTTRYEKFTFEKYYSIIQTCDVIQYKITGFRLENLNISK